MNYKRECIFSHKWNDHIFRRNQITKSILCPNCQLSCQTFQWVPTLLLS